MERQRLHKVLAQSGLGSRREMEEWIVAGRVRLNGLVAEVGTTVGPDDRVTVDRRPVRLNLDQSRVRVLLYHKPEGEIVSRADPQGRPTVFENLPRVKGEKWLNVGRLDFNTSGLLMLTTSGALAQRLTHPGFEVEREYAVRVVGELSEEQRRQSCREILLEDGPAHFERIIDVGGEGTNHWYRVVIKEGRNREVRRLFAALNCMVGRLVRLRFGTLILPPRLKRGKFVELPEADVRRLLEWAGMTPEPPVSAPPQRRHQGRHEVSAARPAMPRTAGQKRADRPMRGRAR